MAGSKGDKGRRGGKGTNAGFFNTEGTEDRAQRTRRAGGEEQKREETGVSGNEQCVVIDEYKERSAKQAFEAPLEARRKQDKPFEAQGKQDTIRARGRKILRLAALAQDNYPSSDS